METFASFLAILGAVLVTSPHREVRLTAFLLWVASNSVFVTVFICEERLAMVGMYCAFLVAALMGVSSHSRKP